MCQAKVISLKIANKNIVFLIRRLFFYQTLELSLYVLKIIVVTIRKKERKENKHRLCLATSLSLKIDKKNTI